MRKEAKIALASVVNVFVILIIFSVVFFVSIIEATSSGSSGSANLTIYDDALPDGLTKLSNYNVTFSANYTNLSNNVINDSNGGGLCQVAFNFSGTYSTLTNMTFNSTNFLWIYNRSFNYKGNHFFNVTCTSSFGNVSLIDNFTVTNTAPAITTSLGGSFIDFDGDTGTNDYWQCSEDTLCTYNFTANITEPDVNDVLTYNYTASSNTTL